MIAREGLFLIAIAWGLAGLLLVTAIKWDLIWLAWVAGLFAVLAVGVTFFFRDPDRTIPPGSDLLVAPADGRVIEIVDEPHPFVGPEARRISIFLSVFDVHVNRIPADGVIDSVIYRPGEFLAAWEENASLKNEQTEITMTTSAGGRIAFRQIAGFIARRIVCRLDNDQVVEAGERFGLIRFGSRTDLILPPEATIECRIGDVVRGGETILARQNLPQSSRAAQQDTGRARL